MSTRHLLSIVKRTPSALVCYPEYPCTLYITIHCLSIVNKHIVRLTGEELPLLQRGFIRVGAHPTERQVPAGFLGNYSLSSTLCLAL